MTVEKLAKKLKVEPAVVLSWEKGESEPDNGQVKRMADIFFVPTDYLLFGVAQGSGIHAMFPSKVKPEPAGAAAILAFISAMILFVGLGGLVILFVLTGSRLVTAGNYGFWEYFMLSDTYISAIGFGIISAVGVVIGIISLILYRKKKKSGDKK